MDARSIFLKYSWAINLVLLLALAFFSAAGINRYFAGKVEDGKKSMSVNTVDPVTSNKNNYRPRQESVVSRDIFKAADESGFDLSDASLSEGDTSDVQETNLRLNLKGVVFYGDDSGFNFATIINLIDQKTGLFKNGDNVTDDAALHKIEYDRVLLARKNGTIEELRLDDVDMKGPKRGGKKERKNMDDPNEREKMLNGIKDRRNRRKKGADAADLDGKIEKISDTEYKIAKSAIDDALSNMNSIVTQARVIPNFVGTGDERVVDGFRIYRIQPNSIFQYLGLNNGDVINSINGQPMDSVSKGLELFGSLKSETSFTLEITRKKNPLEMHYEVE
jgi:type II secretory pathway component PulC